MVLKRLAYSEKPETFDTLTHGVHTGEVGLHVRGARELLLALRTLPVMRLLVGRQF